MRTYHFDDPLEGGLTMNVKNDKDCIFCKNCHSIWDYMNGPYMFFCDKGRREVDQAKTSEEHTCELFEDIEDDNYPKINISNLE